MSQTIFTFTGQDIHGNKYDNLQLKTCGYDMFQDVWVCAKIDDDSKDRFVYLDGSATKHIIDRPASR